MSGVREGEGEEEEKRPKDIPALLPPPLQQVENNMGTGLTCPS